MLLIVGGAAYAGHAIVPVTNKNRPVDPKIQALQTTMSKERETVRNHIEKITQNHQGNKQ